jgi:N-acetylmuramoyl-L-alanine amidase
MIHCEGFATMRAIIRILGLTALAVVLGLGYFNALPAHAVTFDGQYYVPLADFARGNGMGLSSFKMGDENVLTNKTMRLVFDVNSAQAQIAGMNVRLSFPIASDHGRLFISQLDIETALYPLMYSQKPSAKKITTICLDPGHGGKDSGNRVSSGLWAHSEKTYTLALALELQRQLEHAGFRVILTRTKDVYVDLPERPAIANHDAADLFISLHFNASPVDQAAIAGPETYCITPAGAPSSNAHGEPGEAGSSIDTGPTTANRDEDKSLLLAYEMEKSLVISLPADDRGVRRARFAVLRDATMPAILIEGGYMTNPVEGKKIYSAAYRSEMAAAIVRGVLKYQKLVAPVVLHSGTKTNKVH